MLIIRRYKDNITGKTTFSADKAKTWLFPKGHESNLTIYENGKERYRIDISPGYTQKIVRQTNPKPELFLTLEWKSDDSDVWRFLFQGKFCKASYGHYKWELRNEIAHTHLSIGDVFTILGQSIRK